MLQYLDQTHYTFGENKMLNLPAGLIFRTAMLNVTKKILFLAFLQAMRVDKLMKIPDS